MNTASVNDENLEKISKNIVLAQIFRHYDPHFCHRAALLTDKLGFQIGK